MKLSHCLLDLIITSTPNNIVAHDEIPVSSISNHVVMFASFQFKLRGQKSINIIRYQTLKGINSEDVTNDALKILWCQIE